MPGICGNGERTINATIEPTITIESPGPQTPRSLVSVTTAELPPQISAASRTTNLSVGYTMVTPARQCTKLNRRASARIG